MAGAVKGAKAAQYLRFAEGMTSACFQLYNATASGLGAEEITFDPSDGFLSISDASYVQRPEVAESLFYMWRATRDPAWRDMGWQIWSAIERHTRAEGGYRCAPASLLGHRRKECALPVHARPSLMLLHANPPLPRRPSHPCLRSGASDADVVPPPLDDTTQSWFLAETLKYLYLLFAPDSALDLSVWVLNTEAHPLKVSPTAAEGASSGSRSTARRRLGGAANG